MKNAITLAMVLAAFVSSAAVYEFQLTVKTTSPEETTMKYNSKASAKYDETGDIAASYSFPKYVTP